MKTIIVLCLGVFMCLMGCSDPKKDVTIDGGRARGPYMIDVRFVDEAGNNLLDRVRLKEFNGNYWLDKSQYTLQCLQNGKDFNMVKNCQLPAYPKLGMIMLPGSSPIGLLSVDSLFVYQLKFTCLELFGSDKEHVILIEKKQQNQGYLNNFERLLYDGKVIATNMEGDGSDNDRLPIVIVVPQK